MAQLEELAIRYTSAGERAGIVLLKSQQSERYVAINLSGDQASAILPRSAPPGTGMGIQTTRRTCMCLICVRRMTIVSSPSY